MNVLGAVLAGGKSRRFGTQKALATFLNEPMALRALRALDRLCREVVVVTGDPQVGRILYCPTIPDLIPDAGPLGGLHAALCVARARGSAGVVLLGCDMPMVSAEVVSLVVEEGIGSGSQAAVATAGRKGVEPLCGWYASDCLETVEARLAGEDRSLLGLLEALDAHRIPRDHLRRVCDPDVAFRSVNTLAELSDLEDRARDGPGHPTPSDLN